MGIIRYWINTRNGAVTKTQDTVMPEPWKEVDENTYTKAYHVAWDAAMNCGIWHC